MMISVKVNKQYLLSLGLYLTCVITAILVSMPSHLSTYDRPTLG